MDDAICENCGYQGTPEGTGKCPVCNWSMISIKDAVGTDLDITDDDDQYGKTVSIEELGDEEAANADKFDDDDL